MVASLLRAEKDVSLGQTRPRSGQTKSPGASRCPDLCRPDPRTRFVGAVPPCETLGQPQVGCATVHEGVTLASLRTVPGRRSRGPVVDNTRHGRTARDSTAAAQRSWRTRRLRVTVLEGGGHIASILDKASGVSPLWIPPWPSIEPSAYDPEHSRTLRQRRRGSAARRASWATTSVSISSAVRQRRRPQRAHPCTAKPRSRPTRSRARRTDLTMRADLPIAQLQFERQLELVDRTIRVREVVENLSWRAIARLHGRSTSRSARPFSNGGARNFARRRPDRSCSRDPSASATTFGPAPSSTGRMRREPAVARSTASACDAASSSAYTSHLMDPARPDAFFVAFSPARAARLRLCVEDDRLSRGWGSGKKTTAERNRRGMAKRSRGEWNSAFRRCRNLAAR